MTKLNNYITSGSLHRKGGAIMTSDQFQRAYRGLIITSLISATADDAMKRVIAWHLAVIQAQAARAGVAL